LRSLPSVFPPHFFTSTCTDDDSAEDNAFFFSCRRYPRDDDNAVRSDVARGDARQSDPISSPPSEVSSLPNSASDPAAIAV
jgi:hypothetical protein